MAVDDSHEYIFFTDAQSAPVLPEGARIVAASTQRAATEAASAAGRRSLGDVWAMTREVLRHDLDVFFFPAVYSYFPVLNRTKIVVTVHDVIADHRPEATFPNRRLMYFWKLKQHVALHQADLVLTVSEYSRQSILRFFRLPPARVRVTTEGAGAVFRRIEPNGHAAAVLQRYGLTPSDRFLLYVGGISPHKNLGRLIEALPPDIHLVLVGDYERDAFHSDYPHLRELIRKRDLSERVRFAGYVPDDDLVYFYNAATALAFPSLEEGFGLPAVEAMACGTPVVASNRGSLPEVVGNAGRFFDPEDPRDMRKALADVLESETLRAEMRARGLERSLRFTWEASARTTLSLFEELHAR